MSLDPWTDAQTIAQRLQQGGTELLVVLGAAAWCQKCQRLRPAFEQLACTLPQHVLPLWLDLEDHAELLGEFVPPDLPLLLRWSNAVCIQAALLLDIKPESPDLSRRVSLQPMVLQGDKLQDPSDGTLLTLPELWQELSSEGWARA